LLVINYFIIGVEIEGIVEIMSHTATSNTSTELAQAQAEIVELRKAIYHLDNVVVKELKAENMEWKRKFEDIEQSSEHTAYHELEIERLRAEVKRWKAVCLRWQEKADFTLTDSEEEVEDNDPEEYGEYTWKQGLTPEEIKAEMETGINPETGCPM